MSSIDENYNEDIEIFKQSFIKHDIDHDGLLDEDELLQLFQEEHGETIDAKSFSLILKEFDIAGNGKIDLHELCQLMTYLRVSEENGDFFAGDFLTQLKRAIEIFQDRSSSLRKRTLAKLADHQLFLKVKDDNGGHLSQEEMASGVEEHIIASNDPEFNSVFSPIQMRCIALVSHNNMKYTMKKFVQANKNVLKNFRMTGTRSTMAMLQEIFHNEPNIVFGAACESGPLGGDAQLVAQMVSGTLGGVIFFQDPMESHMHTSDIDCFNRQALIHNVMMANNPTTALMMMSVLRTALSEGRADLMPSFFFTLESPSVAAYRDKQREVIQGLRSSRNVIRQASMMRLSTAVDITSKKEIIGEEEEEEEDGENNKPKFLKKVIRK